MVQSFAIVPAAGTSGRMGAPKLLLPAGGRSIIERVLESWLASAVTRTVVVVRASDEFLLERCRSLDVDVVAPTIDPPDMKRSVQLALRHIEASYAPSPRDAWLLAPADLPRLSSAAIDCVLGAYDASQPAAVVPVFAGRRGHPLLMPWSCAARVHKLPRDEGVNALLTELAVREARWDDDSILQDVDTPDDYARLVESLDYS